jgi:sulfur transfer complex TusBCD TusB component (DsrH family)
MAVIKGNLADGKPMQVGGWYNGQQWNGSSLGAAGVENIGANAGKAVSNEVIAQTNPNNVAYIEAQRMQSAGSTSNSIPLSSNSESGFLTSISGDVEKARKELDSTISTQKESVDAKLAVLKEKEANIMENDIKPLTTPFRADLETAERERLHINENFEANQTLINELDSLLTEGNELIKQQQGVTGLAAVRNPRIQKSMDDVTARVGVIQAVINARNGQISVAENMIDRSVNAIAADRKDQIAYYESVLELNNRDIISLDSASKKLAEEQLNLKKYDLEQVTATANKIKELMIDPATAQLVGQAGIKLTDSIETVNKKLANASYTAEVADLSNKATSSGGKVVLDPSKVPAKELVTLTDSRGNKHYYQVPQKANVGTEGERTVASLSSSISSNKMNFPQVVYQYANQMSLSDIYAAYSQSTMGQSYGLPTENPAEIAALYKVAKGEMTETEYNRLYPNK